MKTKLQVLIRNNLKEIILKHSSNQFSPQEFFTEWEGKKLSLNDEAMRILAKTVNEIMKLRPKTKEQYSHSFINDQLIDIILMCYTSSTASLDSKLLDEIKKLLTSLKKPTEQWDFLIPIVNLKLMGIKKLSIGKVNFYDLNLKTFAKLKSKFKIRLGQKKTANERISDFIKNNVNVLAIVSVTAGEIKKAQNL